MEALFGKYRRRTVQQDTEASRWGENVTRFS